MLPADGPVPGASDAGEGDGRLPQLPARLPGDAHPDGSQESQSPHQVHRVRPRRLREGEGQLRRQAPGSEQALSKPIILLGWDEDRLIWSETLEVFSSPVSSLSRPCVSSLRLLGSAHISSEVTES